MKQALNNTVNTFFYIEPYVHINLCPTECLCFNTLNNEYVITKEKTLLNIMSTLLSKDNFRVINCNNVINNKEFLKFLQEVEKKIMGTIISLPDSNPKPIQIPPVLTVNDDIRFFIQDYKSSKSLINSLNTYVHRLHIFINNKKLSKNNKVYNDAYKQFDCIINSDEDSYFELPILEIESLVNSLSFLPREIIISGGNIFAHSQINDIFSLFNSLKTTIIYQSDINDIIANNNKLLNIGSNSLLKAFVIPDKTFNYKAIKTFLRDKDILSVIIRNKDDYDIIQKYNGILNNRNIYIHPYIDKKLIENDVISSLKTLFNDIVTQNVSINNIESKALLNRMLFGNIYVDYLGNVYLHMSQNFIGKIPNNTIYQLLHKEFVNNKVNPWFLTRKTVLPCKECIFSLLCPNISGYELYLEKFNFCFNDII